MKSIFLLFLSLSILSCKSLFNSNSVKKRVWISSVKKVDKEGIRGYQIQESEVPKNGKWTLIKQDIQNFNPKIATMHFIEVKITTIETSENQKETQYKLVKILKEQIETSVRLNDIWGLYSMNGRSLQHGSSMPRIEINLSKDKMLGRAFCNQISSPINALNNRIKFGNVFCTRMACKDLNLENQFLNILKEELFYKFGQNELILYNSITKDELRFKKLD